MSVLRGDRVVLRPATEADLDAIVVVNPGCYRQLQQGVRRRGLRTRVVHIAELPTAMG
jgi:glycolate oxidase iron-sulfur subunit